MSGDGRDTSATYSQTFIYRASRGNRKKHGKLWVTVDKIHQKFTLILERMVFNMYFDIAVEQ